jgi:spore germination protein YaaH
MKNYLPCRAMQPLTIYTNILTDRLRALLVILWITLSSICHSQINNQSQRDTVVKLPSGLNHSPSTKFFAISDSTITEVSKTSVNSRKINMNKRVLGWHPSWMGNLYESYHFDVLTHVVFFGPEIKSGGSNISGLNYWNESKLPEYAKKQNPSCDVLINLFASGAELRSLFRNPSVEDQLISTLIKSVQIQHADGICLDFELVSSDLFSPALDFIRKLSVQLKKEGLQLCMTLPSNPISSLNISPLKGVVDFFILMTYDYSGSFDAKRPGPIAPLYSLLPWIHLSIDNSVGLYKNMVPDSVLCIGIPYFGAIWEVGSRKVPTKGDKFIGYRPYSKSIPLLNHFIHDSVPHCAYITYPIEVGGTTSLRQYWSDDVRTLSDKYDYVNTHGLGGIGIWTLGMDAGRTELWDLLRLKFGIFDSAQSNDAQIDSTQVDTLNTTPPSVFDSASTYLNQVSKYSFIIGFIVVVLALTLFAIMLRMCSSVEKRNKLNDQKIYSLVAVSAAAILFGVCSVVLKFLFAFDWNHALLYSILGLALFFVISIYRIHRQRIQP